MKRFSKVISTMLAGVLLVSTLAACGDKTTKTSGNEKPTDESKVESTTEASKEEGGATEDASIRFSWWGGDSRHEATQKAVEAFMKANEGIKVEVEYGAWDGWAEKVATQLNGGTAPDLMQVNWNWLYQFSSDGSKFVDIRETDFDLSGYPEDLLEQCTVADKLQGVPIGTTGKLFFWNKTTFDKAGIEVPTTWDELVNAGEVFKTKLGEDFYPISMYQYERMVLMLYYLQSKYGKNWVVDGEPQYSVEEIKEGLDWIVSLEEKHILPSIETVLGDGATTLDKNSKWANGTYAGFYEWDSTNQKLKNALEEGQEFVLGEFITGLGDHEAGLTKISQTFAITETSKSVEATAKLMNYLLNEEEGVKLMGTERGMLANKNANKILEDDGVFEGDLTYEANQKVMDFANFSFDPNFENSELKDSTGVYYEVMEEISADPSKTAEMAQYLLDETIRIQEENSY